MCDTARSDGLGVLGLAQVLSACNAQAVDTLVIAGNSSARAPSATPVDSARSGSRCPVCGSTMFQVDDIVAAAMEATVAAGGGPTKSASPRHSARTASAPSPVFLSRPETRR